MQFLLQMLIARILAMAFGHVTKPVQTLPGGFQ
jgi:hypothetical protein